MNSAKLRGTIIGFEEYQNYELNPVAGEISPFRLLSCVDTPLSFIVISPFSIVDDYALEVSDTIAHGLQLHDGTVDDVAVLCVVRLAEEVCYINLRSPIIVNTKGGLFAQVVLENENYSSSTPFVMKEVRG